MNADPALKETEGQKASSTDDDVNTKPGKGILKGKGKTTRQRSISRQKGR